MWDDLRARSALRGPDDGPRWAKAERSFQDWTDADEAELDERLANSSRVNPMERFWSPQREGRNDHAQLIDGKLWQGAFVVDWKDINALGIRCVVNVSETEHPINKSRFTGQIVNWQIDDGDEMPDLFILDAITTLVAQNVKNGIPTMVHCAAGLNRSGLVNAIALIKLTGWDGRKVISVMRDARDPMVLCNDVFEKFVLDFKVRPAVITDGTVAGVTA